MSSELLHIKNKSRAWEKTDTLAQKLEKKRLARLRSVKSVSLSTRQHKHSYITNYSQPGIRRIPARP